jgi:hypothetical protein
VSTSVVNLARVPSQLSQWNPEQAAASIEVIRREAETFAS